MFSTAIKPSADNYALFREDQEHIVKYGTSLHGECFCYGVRIPRHDGAPTRPFFLTAQFHGTQVGCQGKVAVGPYGMQHQESFGQLFLDFKFIL
jgi:hypothetical protein